MFMLLQFELMLFVDVFWNLKLFADVVERNRRRLIVVVAVDLGLIRHCLNPTTVAIGNDDASCCSRRRVRRYSASKLVDDVRMRMMKC